MAAVAKLRAQVEEFERNYSRAAKHAVQQNDIMRRDARSVGEGLSDGITKAKENAIAGVGAAVSAGAIFSQLRRSGEEAQQLLNISGSVDESVDSLLRLRSVTASLNVDFEAATELSRELEDRLGDLGNSEPIEVLNRLGLEADKLIAMPIDQKIIVLSEAFQKGRREGVAYSDLLKLVGDSVGEQLLPVLTQSREELDRMFARAPEDAAATIEQLARMNQMLGETGEQAQNLFTRSAGSMIGVTRFLGDFLSTGSLDRAFEREGERVIQFQQQLAAQQEAAQAKANSVAAAREAEALQQSEAEAAKETAEALKEVQEIRQEMADFEIDLLPDDQKLQAFQQQFQSMLDETIGLFALNFDTSIEGLEELVKAREAMGDKLPETGTNSVLEALQWLQEAKEKQQEIAELEKQIAKSKADRSEKEREELQNLREEAEENTFDRLSPEEQARQLRDELSKSLGIDINGLDDIERGLKEAQEEVDQARAAGDKEAENEALKKLIDTQERAGEFTKVAEMLGASATGQPAQGDFQNFVDEIFNRDPQADQLNELREVVREGQENRRLLNVIIKKMDDPPERDRFDDFGTF